MFCISCSCGTPPDLFLCRTLILTWFLLSSLDLKVCHVFCVGISQLGHVISGGHWEVQSGSRGNEDGVELLGILVACHWSGEWWFGVWDVSEEGDTAHLSERCVSGSQFTGGSHGICQPEGASYSLNVVWWAGEFWLLLSVPFRYCLCYLPSDQLWTQQLSLAKCVGASPLPYGPWSFIHPAGCTGRPSFTNNCCGPPCLPSRSRWACSHRSPDHQRCTWQLLPGEDRLPPLHRQLQPASSLHMETGSWDAVPQSGQRCGHLWTPLHTGEKKQTSTSLWWASWCDMVPSAADGVSLCVWVMMLGRG